ncbi:hypothetical protein [Brevundimonas sp.]|uniref:hypothetical protein n=1 Tax=Brevundimonas sp. TaxID=1871086 RepID=UPI003784DAD3
MKNVIYTPDANPAVYCELHSDAAVTALAESGIAYSVEQENTAAECISCMRLDSQIAIFVANSIINNAAE